MSRKYKLTSESKVVNNVEVFRIKALQDIELLSHGFITKVKAGELGGFVENEGNLSHDGKCWIDGNACVYGNAKVINDAIVCDSAIVGNHALIKDHAIVSCNARIYDNAVVGNHALIKDHAIVSCNARIYDNAVVGGNARVCGEARVTINAKVLDNARVSEEAIVTETSVVYGYAQIYGKAGIYKNAYIYGEAQVYGHAVVTGKAKVYDNARVYGNAVIYDDAIVHDRAKVYGEARVCDSAEIFCYAEVGGIAKVLDTSKVGGFVKVDGATIISDDTVMTETPSKDKEISKTPEVLSDLKKDISDITKTPTGRYPWGPVKNDKEISKTPKVLNELKKDISDITKTPTIFKGGAKRIMERKGRFDLLPEIEIVDIYGMQDVVRGDLEYSDPDELTEEQLREIILELMYKPYTQKVDSEEVVGECYEYLSLLVLYIAYAQYNKTPGDDYISMMVKDLAIHAQNGAEKYGERNCEKGIPFWSFIDSGRRHTTQWLLNECDEPHAISAIWNFLYAMWTINHK